MVTNVHVQVCRWWGVTTARSVCRLR